MSRSKINDNNKNHNVSVVSQGPVLKIWLLISSVTLNKLLNLSKPSLSY